LAFVFVPRNTFQARAGRSNRSVVRVLLSAFLQSQSQLVEFALGQHGNPHGIGPLNAGAAAVNADTLQRNDTRMGSVALQGRRQRSERPLVSQEIRYPAIGK